MKTVDVDDAVKAGQGLSELIAGAEPMLIPAVKVEIPAEAQERPDENTLLRLALDRHSVPRTCYANALLVLRHDPRWAGLRLNTLGNRLYRDGRPVGEEQITAEAAIFLARVYGMDFGAQTLKGALLAIAEERTYNPVQEYLEGLVWDQQQRIGWVAEKILGVKSTQLVEAYVGRFFVGAVARALQPGCKLDTALILVGGQGAGKSTFFKVLFGEWFADSPIPIGSKDAFIGLAACWGYEAAELESLSKAGADAVKQFLSASTDTYRGVFQRFAAQHRRHAVLVGSTNRKQFLVDETGSRRFWPVEVPGQIDLALLREWRDQIWAEAVAFYKAGHQWWLTPEEELLRVADAGGYTEEDPWDDIVRAYLAKQFSSPVQIGEVLDELKVPLERQTQREARRVASILRKFGYERRSAPGTSGARKVWMRGEE